VKIEVFGQPKDSSYAPVEFSHDNNHDGVTYKGGDWVSRNGLSCNDVFKFSHDNNHDGVTYKGGDWVSRNGLSYNDILKFSHDNNHDGVTFKGWDWVSGNGLPYNHVFFGEWHALGTIGVERVFSF
jgi:hypothetical protein